MDRDAALEKGVEGRPPGGVRLPRQPQLEAPCRLGGGNSPGGAGAGGRDEQPSRPCRVPTPQAARCGGRPVADGGGPHGGRPRGAGGRRRRGAARVCGVARPAGDHTPAACSAHQIFGSRGAGRGAPALVDAPIAREAPARGGRVGGSPAQSLRAELGRRRPPRHSARPTPHPTRPPTTRGSRADTRDEPTGRRTPPRGSLSNVGDVVKVEEVIVLAALLVGERVGLVDAD